MLIGDNIRLRAVMKADLPILQEMYVHPEVIRYADSRGDVSLSVFEAKLADRHNSKERKGEWLTIENAEGKIIGSVTYNSRWGSLEVSLEDLYIDTEYQGQGYATAAIARISKYLFEEKEKKRLEVLIREDNHAALRTFEKAGYVREGTRRSSAFSKGKYMNEIFLSKLSREALI